MGKMVPVHGLNSRRWVQMDILDSPEQTRLSPSRIVGMYVCTTFADIHLCERSSTGESIAWMLHCTGQDIAPIEITKRHRVRSRSNLWKGLSASFCRYGGCVGELGNPRMSRIRYILLGLREVSHL